MKKVLFLILIFLPISAMAQWEYIEIPTAPQLMESRQAFDVVEQMPSFPGGGLALMSFLKTHVEYPKVAEENGVQGRVVVQFTIDKDGTIIDSWVVRSVDPSLDKEALRVVRIMPKWSPGTQNGTPVRVKFTLPISFKLD